MNPSSFWALPIIISHMEIWIRIGKARTWGYTFWQGLGVPCSGARVSFCRWCLINLCACIFSLLLPKKRHFVSKTTCNIPFSALSMVMGTGKGDHSSGFSGVFHPIPINLKVRGRSEGKRRQRREEKQPKQTSPNQAQVCLMLRLTLPAAHTHFPTSFYYQSLILTWQIHYLTVHLG